jgi:hypothetical protein
MLFFAIPPFAALVEVVITTAVGTLVTLVTKDAYDTMTQSDDNNQ